MRKLSLSILFSVGLMSGSTQGKLQVTDFVFFNNLDATAGASLPNYFNENAEGLDEIKAQLISILQEKYEITEPAFFKEGISFIDNAGAGRSYKENHKALVKSGDFDHYFLAISSISASGQFDRFSFKTEIKLSNAKGKKVYSNTIEIPFTASFSDDKVSTKNLLSSVDFYKIYGKAIKGAFEETKEELQVFYRPGDPQFDEFIESANKYVLKGFLTQNPLLTDDNNSGINIRIRGGNESEIDITNAHEGLLLHGQRLETPIVTSFRNPMVDDYWITLVQGKENSGFEDLNLAPSADIFLSFNSQPGVSAEPPVYFRLINGRLTGKFDSKTYMISYEPGASLLRIFVDQKLTLLSQPLESGKGQDLKVFLCRIS